MSEPTLRARLGILRRFMMVLIKRRRLGVHVWLWGNPYSDLIYRKFVGELAPEPMTMMQELSAFTRLSARNRLLWIHSEASYSWGRTGEALDEAYKSFVASLDRWKRKGGKVVWTVHDDGLHLNDPDRAKIDTLRAKLRAMTDLVHVHSEAAKAIVIQRFGIDAERIAVIPCPSYTPLYPSLPPHHDDSRNAGGKSLLCFGHVKAYKNYDALGEALQALGPGSFKRLTIAGPKSGEVSLPLESYRRNTALDLRLHFVPDAEVPTLFKNAHFQVLPYIESLTSSAASLSMGFGVPVIAPDLGGMRESVPPSNWPLIYPAEDPNGLTDALRTARDMSPADYVTLAKDCRDFGERIHPDRVSGELVRLLNERNLLVA